MNMEYLLRFFSESILSFLLLEDEVGGDPVLFDVLATHILHPLLELSLLHSFFH